MSENFLCVIREVYEGCSTTIHSVEGETAEIPIRSRVKQGCPLSPIIFNLAMEPLLQVISNDTDGFNLHGERVSVLAYADDLVLTADDPENLQHILDATSRAADWMGLRFNAKKCASLHIDVSKRDSVQATWFQIQGEPIIPLAEGQAYRHLGTPTGFCVRQTPEDTIQEILLDATKIDASLLAPWQKINALNTFLIPRISFVLRGSAVAKVPLGKADKIVRQLVKKWLFLPQRASDELVYITHRHGGANVPRMGDLCDIAVITHAFCLLTCPNAMVRNMAANTLHVGAVLWMANLDGTVATSLCCGPTLAMPRVAWGSASAAAGSGVRSARSWESWCHRSGPMTTPLSPRTPGACWRGP
ncbi:grpE protein homolog 2, mitochondrial isoform X1 [Dermochelys coriacea]|uniref:grpE protein homolog 2, mitochondrial isoform X1 n=1 Tax=Dermochelys coriacea TaxID=27794 RepID=UPI001CA888AE|nr:grpE protein homolog 2, mitochondrial isoform X1 [Dermochelys coriacea]